MSFNLSSKRTTLWLGTAFLLLVVLWALGPVLVPFAVAAVFAYALHPMVLRLQKASPLLPRVFCVLLVEVLALLAVLGIVLLLVPILTREIPLLQQQLPALLATAAVASLARSIGCQRQSFVGKIGFAVNPRCGKSQGAID